MRFWISVLLAGLAVETSILFHPFNICKMTGHSLHVTTIQWVAAVDTYKFTRCFYHFTITSITFNANPWSQYFSDNDIHGQTSWFTCKDRSCTHRSRNKESHRHLVSWCSDKLDIRFQFLIRCCLTLHESFHWLWTRTVASLIVDHFFASLSLIVILTYRI